MYWHYRYVRLTRDPHRKTSEVVGCSQLLLGARRQSSTDPKDKIFAFQGILSLLNTALPAPDYSKSVAQIYREAAAASIHHDHSLMLLSSLTGESKIAGLPSWVPDWSEEDIINELAVWSEHLATGTSRPLFTFSIGHVLLKLRGIIIDTVANISMSYPNPTSLGGGENPNPNYAARKLEIAVLKQCFEMFGNKTAGFFSKFARNAWLRRHESVDDISRKGVPYFWIAAIKAIGPADIADKVLSEIASRKLDSFADLKKTETGATIRKMKAQLLNFHNIIRPLLDRKIMFTTRNRRLGIGYRSLRSGDDIALFSGCNLPMIIRRAGANWRIVCPAYFENAQQDWETWNQLGFPLQDFTFE